MLIRYRQQGLMGGGQRRHDGFPVDNRGGTLGKAESNNHAKLSYQEVPVIVKDDARRPG